MSFIKKIYDISPIFIQNFMISMSGRIKNRSRYGKVYHEHLKFLEEFDRLPIEKQVEYQNKELIKFVKESYKNSELLQEIYNEDLIDNFRGLEDLHKLPIINKDILKENNKRHFSVAKGYVESSTGGTTGEPLIVRFTKDDMMKRMATLDNFKKRHGFISLKMKRATFNGKHIIPMNQKKKIFWRYNRPTKQMIYSSFNISEENLKHYVNSINKFKPDSIDGFFTSIVDLADYIERNNLKLTFQPIAIFPTSETITVPGRELIERVFGCKVYDQYASSEGAPFITEDSDKILRVELSSGVIETLDENSNEVLVTSFTTNGTPLIRYRIGDTMVFEDENLNVIKLIEGRTKDYLIRTDGTRINAGMVANIFKDVKEGLIKSQVIQKSLTNVLVLLIIDKQKYNDKHESIIYENLKYTLGKDVDFNLKYVENIKREKSGKFNFIINEML